MEQKNFCALTGFVVRVTRNTVDGKVYAIASVATHLDFKNASGELLFETSWHDIKFREGKNISAKDLNALEKGSKVSLTGMVVNERYIRADGKEMSQMMILAVSLKILEAKDSTTENKIELVGRVGSVKESVTGGTNIVRLSLATTRVYKAGNNNDVSIETTWHNVNIFTGKRFPAEKMSRIKAGTPLSVAGRIQYQNYTTSNGETRRMMSVVPMDIEILETDKPGN